MNKWIPQPVISALKTDSFEEAFGKDALLELIGQRSQRAIGLDISQAIVSTAKHTLHSDRLNWVATDISAMPFRDTMFDLIFSSSTYGYLDNTLAGLKEAYRILKPGGILIISVNNQYNVMFNLLSKLFIYLGKIPFAMSRAYAPGHFKALLKGAGFTVQAHEPVVHIFPFLNSCINFLTKRNSSYCSMLSHRILHKLKKYSKGRNILQYLTSWFIVFKAQKPTSNGTHAH